MNISQYAQELENRLAEEFAARGANMREKAQSLGSTLPPELMRLLTSLAQDSDRLREIEAPPELALDFVFRCGCIHEQLHLLNQKRIAEDMVGLQPDGTPSPELEASDLDALARFIVLRDQFLKTVADYTLKFLLVSAVLLILGLSLGLI
jgi:hypothetical protein